MLRHLHYRQITLGNPRQQIRPAGNTQIRASYDNQRRIMCENMHQKPRRQFTCQEKNDGQDAAETKHQIKNILQCTPVSLSPVLRAKNRSRPCNRHKEHILDKLNLSCQRNRRHLVLRHLPQHQRVACRHRRQHQTLESNRKCKPRQIPVKFFFVNQYFLLLSAHKNLLHL